MAPPWPGAALHGRGGLWNKGKWGMGPKRTMSVLLQAPEDTPHS
eukprot:CAMPEP_0174350564 /NCGR_PEP_ID=MMETSP0811_2-20130205/7672_1 /TAXON_ID=73025 ORGANISM="Eutreptiella gymnastica-like, Strain CCMP1594" /NCGR_SAMPLE_ID=MMETSP0811_2 /ASSEMBLY_ACC=CAM_ASM_000667 /LENGTH=43 /DNA_ID= /DNA_START= /DNA_END= /DNA_ORIENTATION=